MLNEHSIEEQDNGKDLTQEEIDRIKRVVEGVTSESMYKEAAKFLKDNTNPKMIAEFCLQVGDFYGPNDKATPLLIIASVINELLQAENN